MRRSVSFLGSYFEYTVDVMSRAHRHALVFAGQTTSGTRNLTKTRGETHLSIESHRRQGNTSVNTRVESRVASVQAMIS